MGYLLRLSEKALHELRIDGLIVSDINFLLLLSREGLPVDIQVSSLGSCFNARTADFYQSLGVKRIILPRQLRRGEIRELIAGANPEMEFEVFALNDGCYFEEGFCQTSHAPGPFCLTDFQVTSDKAKERRGLSGLMADHLNELREYLWYQNNCGSSFQEAGLPNGPCSLCWFGYFRDWGIAAVKIAGREASFFRKMRSLQLVKEVMDEVRRGGTPEAIGELARSLRHTPDYCSKGYLCYFREVE
jgi:putative protease